MVVCVYVCARYGFDPSLSELTGLVVRGVKLRVFKLGPHRGPLKMVHLRGIKLSTSDRDWSLNYSFFNRFKGLIQIYSTENSGE